MGEASIGTEARPARIAIIGAGPSGFYMMSPILRRDDLAVTIDLYDRLPAPYGLVRYGVAPDHPKVKGVTKVYERTADDERVRFFGGVDIGKDVTVEEMREHYDAVVFCTGAQSDRSLGIPGEDLVGSHAATAFVGWYNGHPDYRDHVFELDCERAVVVGVGNVALDVARILLRTPEELEQTDIADHALEALRESRVREVVILGRRGPVQAAFTQSEVEELGKMEDAQPRLLPEDLELDPLTQAELDANDSAQMRRRLDTLAGYVAPPEEEKSRTLWIRFLASPTELLGDDAGRVRAVEVVRNELKARPNGSLAAVATDTVDTIEAGLVFRSVGYRGIPIEGVPFREDWATIPHEAGRVEPGLYASGWIKRGPSGVIGTNRPDSKETAESLMEDITSGAMTPAPKPVAELEALLRSRGVRWLDLAAWKRVDALEQARGASAGRPRRKFVTREALFEAADQAAPDETAASDS